MVGGQLASLCGDIHGDRREEHAASFRPLPWRDRSVGT